MIQVIERSFAVVEHIAAHEAASVKDLAEACGLAKGTLCNILRTLSGLGYVAKGKDRLWMLGPKWREVAWPQFERDCLAKTVRQAVVELANASGETAQAAILRGGERYVIAEARAQQGLTVDPLALPPSGPFGTATGRVLLAHAPEPEAEALHKACKTLDADWPEAKRIGNFRKALSAIRETGMASLTSGSGEVVGLAAPVFGRAREAAAALGIYLPVVRFSGAHEKTVTHELNASAKRASVCLQAALGESV